MSTTQTKSQVVEPAGSQWFTVAYSLISGMYAVAVIAPATSDWILTAACVAAAICAVIDGVMGFAAIMVESMRIRRRRSARQFANDKPSGGRNER